ncbi:MAG TPA: phage tail protein, partial [Mesotoga infera]|nr:phage tail protein [Mesotoga infera]
SRDFTDTHLVVQALTEEIILENMITPARYGMVWDDWDIADVARDLVDNWYVLRVKDQTEWEAAYASDDIDTSTEPGLVMLAKDDNGSYISSGYIDLHFESSSVPNFKNWGRIRWASDNGGDVKTTMQYSIDGITWSEEVEGALPDQVGVDPGWTDEEDVYIRINLYTEDTTSEDDEGNPVGQTPFVFAVEMLARVSSDILSSSIPLETGMTVKGLVADGENALAILREACENVHAGPAGMTGSEKYEFYVQNGVLYLVSEIGSDQTDECVFRAGTNTEIDKLSDDDEELCNVLLARGKGDGINRLQKEFRDYDSIAEYGEYRKVVDFDVDNITDLTTKAEAYLEEFSTPVVAFSIQTMFPINAEPSYGLGDYVRVVDPKTGVVSTVRIMQETREYTENGLIVHLQLGRPAVNLNDAIGYEPPIRQVDTFRPQGVWARGIIQGIVVGFNKPKNPNWETTEVHLSVSKGFEITAETLVKSAKQNKFEILELEGNTRYYIRLVNIDTYGNRSDESGEVSAVAQLLDVGDIGDGVAPATPASLSLTTFYREGKAYVKANWADNSETDLKG